MQLDPDKDGPWGLGGCFKAEELGGSLTVWLVNLGSAAGGHAHSQSLGLGPHTLIIREHHVIAPP
jgi:hypothetical protein